MNKKAEQIFKSLQNMNLSERARDIIAQTDQGGIEIFEGLETFEEVEAFIEEYFE